MYDDVRATAVTVAVVAVVVKESCSMHQQRHLHLQRIAAAAALWSNVCKQIKKYH